MNEYLILFTNLNFKGYGYGAGASFLSTDRPTEKQSSNGSTSDKISQSPPNSSPIPSTGFFSSRPQSPRNTKRSWTLPTNNDICPRCSKAVYAAESVNLFFNFTNLSHIYYILSNFISYIHTGVRCWS